MAPFSFVVMKYFVTAALVVLISEVAKYLTRAGALIAALPTVTILVLVWMYMEDQPPQRLSDHAYYTFWYVLPTLPMFLLFPALLSRYSFWITLGMSALLTIACFAFLALIVKSFGIKLV